MYCAMECDYECTDKNHTKVCSDCGNYIVGKGIKVPMIGRYWCEECGDE